MAWDGCYIFHYAMNNERRETLRKHIANEIELADAALSAGDPAAAFHHLERAHVLGQGITYDHTRVHWRMLQIGWRTRNWQEVFGQLLRIAGASTKTPLGIYPTGNTGGANVYFFKAMPIPDDLQQILNQARMK